MHSRVFYLIELIPGAAEGHTGDPNRLVTHYRFYVVGPKLAQQTSS